MPTPAESLIGMDSRGRRSLENLLEPMGREGDSHYGWLGAPSPSALPCFRWRDASKSDPIRVGFFAGLHGDEPAGCAALMQLLETISQTADLAGGYDLRVYPVCNPHGFQHNTRENAAGRDLNREFWKGSDQVEVQLLEKELQTHAFHGIVQLHADDTSDGVYGYARGATLTEHLLRPALNAAERFLPRNLNPVIDGWAARDGIIYDHFDGILAAPEAMDPLPFEIVLETPALAPVNDQASALAAALETILKTYREFIAFAADI